MGAWKMGHIHPASAQQFDPDHFFPSPSDASAHLAADVVGRPEGGVCEGGQWQIAAWWLPPSWVRPQLLASGPD